MFSVHSMIMKFTNDSDSGRSHNRKRRMIRVKPQNETQLKKKKITNHNPPKMIMSRKDN